MKAHLTIKETHSMSSPFRTRIRSNFGCLCCGDRFNQVDLAVIASTPPQAQRLGTFEWSVLVLLAKPRSARTLNRSAGRHGFLLARQKIQQIVESTVEDRIKLYA